MAALDACSISTEESDDTGQVAHMEAPVGADTARGLRRVLVPLALAQFICSFAGSNMNVMINDMSQDLDTTVQGIQVSNDQNLWMGLGEVT